MRGGPIDVKGFGFGRTLADCGDSANISERLIELELDLGNPFPNRNAGGRFSVESVVVIHWVENPFILAKEGRNGFDFFRLQPVSLNVNHHIGQRLTHEVVEVVMARTVSLIEAVEHRSRRSRKGSLLGKEIEVVAQLRRRKEPCVVMEKYPSHRREEQGRMRSVAAS